MLKIYMLIVVVGLVGGVVYGGYYYYKDTQSRIQTLTENNSKLEVATQQQEQTINTLIEDREKFDELNKELQVKLAPLLPTSNLKSVPLGHCPVLNAHFLLLLSCSDPILLFTWIIIFLPPCQFEESKVLPLESYEPPGLVLKPPITLTLAD